MVSIIVTVIGCAVLCVVCFTWGCSTGYWQAVEDYGIDVDAFWDEVERRVIDETERANEGARKASGH